MKNLRGVVALLGLGWWFLLAGCASYEDLIPSTDHELAQDVTRRLREDDVVGRYPLGVNASEGIVTLRGTVRNHTERMRATAIAEGTPGVQAVDNKIERQ